MASTETDTTGTTGTSDTRAIAWTLQSETEGLLRAIGRAEADLRSAREALQRGNVPHGSLGRILSQSALDVDSYGARLQAVLSVVGAAGLSEAQVLGALQAAVAKSAR